MRKTYIILFLLCLTFSTRSKADNKQWPQYIDTSATYNEAYRHDPEMKLYFLYPDKMKTGIKYPTLIFFFGAFVPCYWRAFPYFCTTERHVDSAL